MIFGKYELSPLVFKNKNTGQNIIYDEESWFQHGLCLKPLIKGTRQLGFSATLRNGCCKSSIAVALCAGSRTSVLSRKPSNLGEI